MSNAEEVIEKFQKELKLKLQYKASSKISADTYLYKSFKFFDLYNNGYVAKSDFLKAIAKCGVVIDTHDIQAVYNHYDTHRDGNIYYKEFIEGLLFSQSEMSSSQISQRSQKKQNKQASKEEFQHSQIQQSRKSQQSLKQSKIDRIYNECQTYSEVSNLIKKNLRQKGISALLNLAIELKSTDTSRTHKINKNKLKQKLNYLSQKAISLILQEFAQGNSNQINYAEFIYSLKGQLQPINQNQVIKAFNFIDQNNEKEVTIQKVIQSFKYNTYKQSFLKAIDFYQTFQGIDDGVFTDEDFIDFFGFLAFSFFDPQKFITFIQKAYFDEDAKSNFSQKSNRSRQFQQEHQHSRVQNEFKQQFHPDFRKNKEEPISVQQNKPGQTSNMKQIQFSGDKKSVSKRSQSEADKKSSTTSIYVKEVQMIVLRIKKRLASKGTKGYLVFQKALKSADTNEDGLISLDEFKKVIRDLKIDITNSESELIFDVFDPDSTNLISYSEMIHTFKGNVPPKRAEFFERVWNTVKVSEEHTTFSQIRHSLNFKGHPDIQTGRRYDDEILKQIQQTILLIQELNQNPRSQQITKKEFYQYFENLSLSTPQDILFESLLQNFWKMQVKVNIQQLYAGSRKLFDPNSKGYLMDHHRYAVKGGTISSNAPFGTSSEPTNYFTQHSKL